MDEEVEMDEVEEEKEEVGACVDEEVDVLESTVGGFEVTNVV